MALAHFHVDTSTPGQPRVVVNGEDLSVHVESVHVRATSAEVPQVVLELRDGAEIEGDGIVVVPTHPDLASAMRQWVGALDPAEIERLILERSGGLGGESTGQAAVGVLKELLG